MLLNYGSDIVTSIEFNCATNEWFQDQIIVFIRNYISCDLSIFNFLNIKAVATV